MRRAARSDTPASSGGAGFLLLCVLCFPAAALAETPTSNGNAYLLTDMTGARSVGMADAFRAVGSTNEAIAENPAALAIGQRYELDGFFGYAFNAPASYWNASIVDANTTPVAVGISYTHLASGKFEDRFGGSNLRLALGYALIPETLYIGITGNWLDFSGALPTNAITMDAAVVYQPVAILSIAAIGYNLIDVDNETFAPRKAAIAAAVGSDTTFRIAADVVGTFGYQTVGAGASSSLTLDYHLGGEVMIAQMVALRAGYLYDGLIQQSFGAVGAGIVVTGVAIDVGFRQSIVPWNDNAIIVDLKFFLPT